MRTLLALAASTSVLLAWACSTSNTSSTPVADAGGGEIGGDAGAKPLGPELLPGCPQDPGPPALDLNATSKTDPTGGAEAFTLAAALAGYPETTGVLTALVTTEMGTIRCELDEAKAPVTVANFVGLARGTRPYRRGGKWNLGRFYDGLLWHRVVPGFVIQGGDPFGTGAGGAGYDIPNENHVEEPLGTLAMAAGDTPSSSQFYVVVGQGPAADYNVFGICQVETAIAISEVDAGPDEKPLVPVHMQRIDIARCQAPMTRPAPLEAGARDAGPRDAGDPDAGDAGDGG